MDPDTVYAIVLDQSVDLTDRFDALRNLSRWLQTGGFAPKHMTETRVHEVRDTYEQMVRLLDRL